MRHVLVVLSVVVMFGGVLMGQQKSGDAKPGQACALKVSGMVCSACANTVEKTARKIAGVAAVKANQPKGMAEITYDPSKTSPEAIARVINAQTPFKAEVQKQ